MQESEFPSESIEAIVDPENPDDVQTVCGVCLEQNLTGAIITHECLKCDKTYCVHFASPLDAQYCMYCLNHVEIMEEILTKHSEHINEETKKIYTRTQRARHLVIGGTDWLFINRKIESINDVELGMAIEYHQAIYNGMLYEREKRRIEHFHRNAGKDYKVRISTTDTPDAETTTTVTKVKKLKIKTTSSKEVNLRATIEAMLKAGLKPADIMAMGKKGD